MNIRDEYPELFQRIEYGDSTVVNSPKYREFSLRIRQGDAFLRENVSDQIHFCPFTGKRLPQSLRDLWFDKLDALGLELNSKNIPAQMHTDEWWQELP